MDTANDKSHPALPELSAALRQLHHALVEVTRMEYERDHSLTLTPLELLHRLLHEPFFQWLRPLSELIVDLDAGVAESDPDAALDAKSARREAENFLSTTNYDFWQFYEQHLQKPRVAIAYARVQQVLRKLPGAEPPQERQEIQQGEAATLQ